jgi:hypothetical protein
VNLCVEHWNTEYGDPLPGESVVECPCCYKEFTLDTEVSVSYTARK